MGTATARNLDEQRQTGEISEESRKRLLSDIGEKIDEALPKLVAAVDRTNRKATLALKVVLDYEDSETDSGFVSTVTGTVSLPTIPRRRRAKIEKGQLSLLHEIE